MSDEAMIERIARICHEANRAYCAGIGDLSHKPWDEAPEWQRKSAVSGVKNLLDNPGNGPESSHENWLRDKTEAGWVFGTVKDEVAKTHPCMVPYRDLPPEQRVKDSIFHAVVSCFREIDMINPNVDLPERKTDVLSSMRIHYAGYEGQVVINVAAPVAVNEEVTEKVYTALRDRLHT